MNFKRKHHTLRLLGNLSYTQIIGQLGTGSSDSWNIFNQSAVRMFGPEHKQRWKCK